MKYTKILLYLSLILSSQQIFTQEPAQVSMQKLEDKMERFKKLNTEKENLIYTEVPDFEGIDMVTGDVLSNNSIQGKITILNFNTAAEYCAPGEFQHDELNYLHQKIDTSAVQIISVYSDNINEVRMNRKVEEDGIPIIHLDKIQIENIFKVKGGPVNLIIDESGTIRAILKNSSWQTLQKEILKVRKKIA